MNTISTIIEPSADGTLHLPVPAEWRHFRIRITAEMEPVDPALSAGYPDSWHRAFGGVTDETFETPARGRSRMVESFDSE